jgi:predicted ATPase
MLLAETAGLVGQVDEGLCPVAEVLTALEATERGDLLAKTYRLQGTLRLR